MALCRSAASASANTCCNSFIAASSKTPLRSRRSFARPPARLVHICQGAAGQSAAQPEGPDQHLASHSAPQEESPAIAATGRSDQSSKGVVQRIKNFFGGDRLDMQRLKALGLGAVASYGFVSNATYGTGLAISWITFVRQTGKSPLMANQWKPFLALYGGFWAAQHFIRPLRFSLALFMSPVFDKFINWVQQRTHFKRQNAFAIYLFLLGSVTSISVFGSIRLFAGPVAFATA